MLLDTFPFRQPFVQKLNKPTRNRLIMAVTKVTAVQERLVSFLETADTRYHQPDEDIKRVTDFRDQKASFVRAVVSMFAGLVKLSP
jgi:hypothetical protein